MNRRRNTSSAGAVPITPEVQKAFEAKAATVPAITPEVQKAVEAKAATAAVPLSAPGDSISTTSTPTSPLASTPAIPSYYAPRDPIRGFSFSNALSSFGALFGSDLEAPSVGRKTLLGQ